MYISLSEQMKSMDVKYPGGGKRDAEMIVNSMLQYPKGEKHLIHLKSKEGGALPFLFKINDGNDRFPYTVYYNTPFSEVDYAIEDMKSLQKFIINSLG